MSGLHTSTLRTAHDYTRAPSPWIIGEYKSIYGKLIHYISGGGMSTFGRTVNQEMTRAKHRRFLIKAAIFAALWLYFYFCD